MAKLNLVVGSMLGAAAPDAADVLEDLVDQALVLQEGDRLALVREADNRHDPHAVRVEWRGTKLGYLPRSDNRAVAAEMDKGTPIGARIGRLSRDPNPWKRLRVDVYVGL